MGSARPPAGPHDTKTQDATHSSTPPAAGCRAEEGTTKGSPQTGKTKESQFAAAEDRHCTGTRALARSRVANQPAAGRGARRAPRWKEMKWGQGIKTVCCCCCCCGAGGGVGWRGVGGAMCPAQAPTQPALGAARGARQGARTQACRPGPGRPPCGSATSVHVAAGGGEGGAQERKEGQQASKPERASGSDAARQAHSVSQGSSQESAAAAAALHISTRC